MRLLVAGSRDWTDWEFVYQVLDACHRKRAVTVVIEGEGGREDTFEGRTWVTSGADLWAREWATARGVTLDSFRADWATLGRAAGPLRNQQMIDVGKPDGAVIFPGGRGTQDMRKRLDKAGIRRWEPIPLVGLEEKEARAR